ncbi:MAG: NERD domain-containing protein [Epulopiscium sp.]|nr:NERD domain-containing protein [Candidatus Epulonipiscium sp.]
MAKVIQEADYIKKRKLKYFIRTSISLGIMLGIFISGLILTKTRNNLFTLVAILFTLVVAQYGVQYISIIPYKDGSSEVAKQLESLSHAYVVWNSALFGDQKGMAFFDHVLFSDTHIYCIMDEEYKNYNKNIENMKRIVEQKGLKDNIIFIQRTKGELNQLLKHLENKEIKDLESQKEFIEALKTAAI